jgi:hypothetical protein
MGEARCGGASCQSAQLEYRGIWILLLCLDFSRVKLVGSELGCCSGLDIKYSSKIGQAAMTSRTLKL